MIPIYLLMISGNAVYLTFQTKKVKGSGMTNDPGGKFQIK